MRGAGWGHGIGMSQYGAYGFAKQGAGYREILDHYYRDTQIETPDGGVVRVLLQPNRPTVSSATPRRPATGSSTRTRSTRPRGRATRSSCAARAAEQLSTFDGMSASSAAATSELLGRADNGVRDGLYRGAIEIRTAAGPGLNAINALGHRGLPARCRPEREPVLLARRRPPGAGRGGALVRAHYRTSTATGFNQYADTRSQVYRGYLGETPSTSSAVAATPGEVVTYGGQAVATTFFFSTSGGYTENIENVFTGAQPRPWLKGVKDPYDDASPYHRWGPNFSRDHGSAPSSGAGSRAASAPSTCSSAESHRAS